MALPDFARKEIEDIRSDNVNGAEVLMQRAVELFRRVGADDHFSGAAELQGAVRETARLLVSAQPSMAGLFTIANAFLWATDALESLRTLQDGIAETGQKFLQFGEQHLALIAEHASRLIQSGKTVVTHSNSNTVSRALIEAKKAGKEFSVVCTESRPMMEGVTLARQLGDAGIPVTLVTDAGVFGLIGRSHVILFGADAVAAQGLVNKVGTLGISAVARQHRVPCYALCSTLKFSPLPGTALTQREGNKKELLSGSARNVTPLNLYFDLTPLELLAGIITEEGTMPLLSVKAGISSLNIHPILR